jgi:hypothetical protein
MTFDWDSWADDLYQAEQDQPDRCATPNEAIDEYARNAGPYMAERAWLLTDWDVWVANPAYNGPPVPHPESD